MAFLTITYCPSYFSDNGFQLPCSSTNSLISTSIGAGLEPKLPTILTAVTGFNKRAPWVIVINSSTTTVNSTTSAVSTRSKNVF